VLTVSGASILRHVVRQTVARCCGITFSQLVRFITYLIR